MIILDRIYTRGGDQGMTSVGNGQRVSKLHPRIIAGGSVDELNSAIGCAVACQPDSPMAFELQTLQQFLFDLGADLCTPLAADVGSEFPCPRVNENHVTALEHLIDKFNLHLQPLTSFVLPGGKMMAASLHLARSINRRAEVDVLRLAESEVVNPQLIVCLNRLSDLLFVMARAANDNGMTDILWKPGNSILAIRKEKNVELKG